MRYNDYIIKSSTTLLDVMATLDKQRGKTLYIVNEQNQLLGSITDGDVRRYVIRTQSFAGIASDVMKSPCIFASSLSDAAQKQAVTGLGSIPVVNEKQEIVDIWFDAYPPANKEIDVQYRNTPVVMMAGGKGERLYPYTTVLPKPLIPIQGVPIAQRIIDRFASVGFHRFFLSLNYKKNIIKAYFDEVMNHVEVSYYEEDEPMGTAGSLRLMQQELTQDFFVINCDMLITVDLEHVLKFHQQNKNAITVVSALKSITVPYGVFDLSASGEIEAMREKPVFNQFINTGMYVVNPAALKHFPAETSFHMTDVIQACMENKLRVGAYVIDEKAFMDMGQMDELKIMQQSLL